MFSREDILKQLRDGADPQTIATAMADAINGAISDYEKEQAETKAKEESAVAEKRKDARAMVDAMADFLSKHFGETMDEEDCDRATDAIIELTDHMIKLNQDLRMLIDHPQPTKSHKVDAMDDIDDNTIRAFLASLK